MTLNQWAVESDGSQPLDPKREKFLALILDGKSPLAAYKKLHPKSSNPAAEVESSRWRNDPKFALRFRWMQKQSETETTLTQSEKREKLAKLVREEAEEVRDIIKAIEVDNVMAGHNKPTEIAVSGEITVIDKLADLRAKKYHKKTG